MSADFSKLMQALAEGRVAHVARDGLAGVHAALFLARGGRHGPGERCPNEEPAGDRHAYWCLWPDDECDCGGE